MACPPPLWHRLIAAMPEWMRFIMSLALFWPSVLKTRIHHFLCPARHRLWDRVHPNVIIGALPLMRSDVQRLYTQHNVRCVINMCKEWGGHVGEYNAMGIRHLRLPTTDYCVPSLERCRAGVAAIAATAAEGGTAFVHCKAGKGRSLVLTLCYLVRHGGMTPVQAQAHVQRLRPRVTKTKYLSKPVQAMYAEAAAAAGGSVAPP